MPVRTIIFDRETGIHCDFSPAEEPVGRRARPGCRVRDRAEAAARGPVPAARAPPGVLLWLGSLRGGAGPGRGRLAGRLIVGAFGAKNSSALARAEQVAAIGRLSDRAACRRAWVWGAGCQMGQRVPSVPPAFAGLQTTTSCRLPARSIVSRNS